MPYVTKVARQNLDRGHTPETAGELNYLITLALKPLLPKFKAYIMLKGQSYQTYNDLFGAMFGACLELIRRMFPSYGEYEDSKIESNGDCY